MLTREPDEVLMKRRAEEAYNEALEAAARASSMYASARASYAAAQQMCSNNRRMLENARANAHWIRDVSKRRSPDQPRGLAKLDQPEGSELSACVGS